jgi:hypothetical protein
MCYKAIGGTEGASQAFKTLESRLQTLRGRRLYGTYNPFTDEYKACVQAVEGENAESVGLESWTIPGGKYATRRVPDWKSKLGELPLIFDNLAKGRRVDKSRPSVEYYRSEKELIIYLPLLD